MRSIIAAALCTLAGVAHAAPPVFTELPYEEARAKAADAGKLFIVDATAEWCGPCKLMDRQVWVDERVESWLGEHAVASQVDVDHQREIATDLGIRAMPTIIAFRGETEIDRVVGYQSPTELLDWLGDVKEGRSRIDELRDNADRAGEANVVEARHELARGLAMTGRGEEAVDEYVWLWEHALEHDPSFVGVRVSFMASEMKSLVFEGHGRDAFTALRDEAEARLKGDSPTWDDLTDWITLNDVIGDAEATLAWIDRNKVDDEGRETIRRYMHDVEPLLLAHDRWADLGLLIEDPVWRLRNEKTRNDTVLRMLASQMDPEQVELQKAYARQGVIDLAAMLHGAMLASDRNEEAWNVVDAAIEIDDTPRMRAALVERAIDLDGASMRHRALLDGVEQPDLAARLEQALQGG